MKEREGAAATTTCGALTIYIEDEEGAEGRAGGEQALNPSVLPSLGSGHLAERERNNQVNAAIEAFLDRV